MAPPDRGRRTGPEVTTPQARLNVENPHDTDKVTVHATAEAAAPLQLFDALPVHIEAALTASIERFGVLVPVVTDQHGTILDGHHRKAIADRLGVKYRVDIIWTGSDEDRGEIARTLNADRRQLTEDQRREVAAALREQGHSVRAIAAALGVGKSTIGRDLSTVPDGTVPERVTGLDGKSRPARRPLIAIARNQHEAAAAQRAMRIIEDADAAGMLDAQTLPLTGIRHDLTKVRAALRRGTLDARDIRNAEAAAGRLMRAAGASEFQARQAERVRQIAERHPSLARFIPAIERGEIELQVTTTRWRQGWTSFGNEPGGDEGPGELWLHAPDRTRRYDWQDFDWPRYSGVRDTCLDEDAVAEVPLFSPAEWDEFTTFSEQDALEEMAAFEGAEWFLWGRGETPGMTQLGARDRNRDAYRCPAVRRDYDPAYGAIITQHDESYGCGLGHPGKPLFIRRGWGDWHAAEFNDGSGGRERHRYFCHDHALSMFVEYALNVADPLAFTGDNLRDIQREVYQAMPAEWSWFYARHKTIDHDGAVAALESSLAALRAAEPLSAEEISRRAVEWMQSYIPAEFWDTGTWRQGKITKPRRPDGTADDDELERLFGQRAGNGEP